MDSLSNLRNGLEDDSIRPDGTSGASDIASLEIRRRQKHLSDHEQVLTNQFKAAALQLTTLYRSSLSSSKESYEAGYLHALSHVLELLVRSPTSFPSMMTGTGEGELQQQNGNLSSELTPEQGLQRLKWLTGYLQRRIEAMSTSDDDEDAQPMPSSSSGASAVLATTRGQTFTWAAPKRFEGSSSPLNSGLRQQMFRSSPLHAPSSSPLSSTVRFSEPDEGASQFGTPTSLAQSSSGSFAGSTPSEAAQSAPDVSSRATTPSASAGKAPQTPTSGAGTKRTRHDSGPADPALQPELTPGRRKIHTRSTKSLQPSSLAILPNHIFSGGSSLLSTIGSSSFNFKPSNLKMMDFSHAAVAKSKTLITPRRVRRTRSGRLRPVAGLRAGDADGLVTDSENDWIDDEAEEDETTNRRRNKRRKSTAGAEETSSTGAQGDVDM